MKTIKLNESKLRDIIRESVKKTLNEMNFEQANADFEKAIEALDNIINNSEKPESLRQTAQDAKEKLTGWFETTYQNADWSHDSDAMGHDEDGHVDPSMGLDF